MKTEIKFGEEGQITSIVTSPSVLPTSPSSHDEGPYGGDFAPNTKPEDAHGSIGIAPTIDQILSLKPKNELLGWTIGIVAAAALFFSVQSCRVDPADKITSGNIPSAVNKDEGQCVFHGIRRFRAWKDMDIGTVVPKIVDIEEMPECRDEALAQVIRMNKTHPYATTSLVKKQRAKHPYRIVVKKP